MKRWPQRVLFLIIDEHQEIAVFVVERLMDAILAAPIEGVVGARAKISLLLSERRNILEPEEVQDALEIILRGLEQSEPSSKAETLKEAA